MSAPRDRPGPAGRHAPADRPGPPTHRATAAAVLATSGLESLPHDHAARLPPLLEAMNDLGTGPELHSTLDRMVRTAARIADCRYAAIGVLSRSRKGLQHFVTHGLSDEERAAITQEPDLTHGLLGSVLRYEEPLRLAEVSEDPEFAGFPEGHPVMHTFLGFPVRVDGRHVGNLYLAGKRGGGEFTENDALLIKLLATEAGIAVRNARLYEAARQRERWIEGSAAVTTSLLSGDVDNALTVVAEQARRLADAAAGMVLLPTPERGLEVVAASADDARGLLGTVMRPGTQAVEQLLAGEAVFVDDSATDPRMLTPIAKRFGPSMMLPLESGDRIIGSLAVPRVRGAEPFTDVEKDLAGRFAAQAALTLVLADVQRDRERLAVYEDRDRIARDLHDLVIQRIFSAGMTLQGTQRRATDPAVTRGIEAAIDQLDATIAEIRTAIFALQQDPGRARAGLRTRVLRETGLAAESLRFRPALRFVGPVDSQVSEPTTRELVAALREALSNAVRHASATRVEVLVDATVTLTDSSPGVRLTVADDGVGTPAQGRRSGLANLARRAENLGGRAWLTEGLDTGGAGGSGDAGSPGGPGRGTAAVPHPGTTLHWEARR